MKKRNNAWLQKHFNSFNKNYFYDRLLAIRVIFAKPLHGASAHWDPAERTIIIDEGLNTFDRLAMTCLLHEMAHAALDMDEYVGGVTEKDPHHAMRFQAEIWRLIKAGAYDGLL